MEALLLFEQDLQNCNMYLSVFNLKGVQKTSHYYYTFRERKKKLQTNLSWIVNQFEGQLKKIVKPNRASKNSYSTQPQLFEKHVILNACLDSCCYKD